ncbi:flavin reductase family protein [Streptomyces sp. NBC_01549]|uniref:flavin reductase family protein n=1 Tax=Streptomyces sp. NBC_01549 TaxID=2975874 RepID=UPI00225AB7DC|nr:flavin reductase family protein [Streptomyces sp. NBC_01549]MCX4591808.1 flavin reductase family protein [Streptomyces sp. NBC_01549]
MQPIEGAALRRVCAHFATGVTVITTGTPGSSAGTTVNSFTSVSLEPPLVLFCLHQHSRLRSPIQQSGGFVVNFLTRQQESLAWAFAGRESAKVEDVPHHRTADGLPVLSGALAYLSCRLVEEYDGGDHTIVLGEVVGLGAAGQDEDPLIFYRGSIRALDGELAS